MNQLFFGDNLDILREHIKDESVDLVYLDPPFNSKRDYSVLFKTPKGHESDAQITAFEDSWHWGEQAEREFDQLVHSPNTQVSEMMQALRKFLGQNDMMAYLTMMANRLLELHRVLKPTGSIYLHCDPTASHYLKIIMDGVFSKENFISEVIWQRANVKGDARLKYGAVHDTLLFYGKTKQFHFRVPHKEPDAAYYARFSLNDEDGKGPYHSAPLDSPNPRPNLTYEYKGYQPPLKGWRVDRAEMERLDKAGRLILPPNKGGRIRRKLFLNDAPGPPVGDVWTDINTLQSQGERLGYPTQKPLALLDRIITASSLETDLVLDPFCGCGTAVHAAQKLGRRWIGIDITHLAVSLIEKRLKDAFPGIQFEVEGTPKDVEGARNLALRDKYQFQWWACSLVNAQPYMGKKKGADGGIDGLIFFADDKSGMKKIVVSVKGGENVSVTMIRDLAHVIDREKAAIGLFVTLAEPTRPMKEEAISLAFYDSERFGTEFPKLQILTIEGLMAGTERPRFPDLTLGRSTFKRAGVENMGGEQGKLI
jgi:site-specific DNA-methyltransferase (adenine-specific)